VDHVHAWISRVRRDLSCVVQRAVINDDAVPGAIGLGNEALKCERQVLLRLVGSDYDA